ncbi:TIGR02281 family clan AA aspartic protease [Rickettsia endosymbiont of Halotydeus destructor]|uniref:TIGR02281 family clan AA aspartic protease n=1 Tax=Rickettsia endosymbiont of Halotydeus destructor TaxID=2996754 RepID=UPI003BB0D420
MSKNLIKSILIFCIGIFAISILYKFIDEKFPKFFDDSQNFVAFFSSVIILISFIYSFFSQNNLRKFFLQLSGWGIIFLVIIIGYAFRFELTYASQRVLSVLIPSYSWVNRQGEIVIARSSDGHFYIDAFVNNIKIKFMIDTGASDVALTVQDAKKLGFDLSKLNYNRVYLTANGESKAAPITLDSVTIGRVFKNVEGHIGAGGLDISLLGMSVLQRFKSFEINKDMLILSY